MWRSIPIGRLPSVVLVGAVVAVVGCGDPGGDDIDLNPPATREERATARVALKFAALLQRGEARAACDLARGEASRSLSCSRNPRIPEWLRIPPRQKLEIIDVLPAKVAPATRLGIPVKAMPVLAVEVDPLGHVVYLVGYGYA